METVTACCGARVLGRRALKLDDEWICMRHMSDDHRARIRETDESVRGRLGRSGWPYGADGDVRTRERLAAWLNGHDLRRSNGSECLHWLISGSCRKRNCIPGHRGWRDHLTAWISDTHRVLVSHPYHLSDDSRAELAEIVKRNPGVVTDIQREGWYGNGTWQITLWAER